MNIRQLQDSDYETLISWWEQWPEWQAPAKDFLPDNGTGGLIVEAKDGTPIVAGFLYMTNSKAVLLEWIISNPEYREADRDAAITALIIGCENLVASVGKKYMFTIGRNKHLIKKHKDLGWHVDEKPSYEIIKKLKN
tara:strand:+ start:976 stop:1386 length:411 start_codon:yes stop_codon:yes gene_type:complete